MPGGVINPKGRKDLRESSRDMTPSFYGESDIQLGLNPKVRKKWKAIQLKKKKAHPNEVTIKDALKAKQNRRKIKSIKRKLADSNYRELISELVKTTFHNDELKLFLKKRGYTKNQIDEIRAGLFRFKKRESC